MSIEKTDVLVIGAGPAGCIAASIVHKNGLRVRVVEKTKFPRFVIGESLLPRVMDHLEETGLLEEVKKGNFQEKFGAKFVMNDKVCDFNFSDQFTKGWNWTWQVPRAQFDQLLATGVAKKNIPVDFESGVTSIQFNEDESSITTVEDVNGKKTQIEARYIIDASGYGRVIPTLLGLNKQSSFDPRKTHFTHFKDPNRPEGVEGNRITVVVHRQQIWIWIIPFSNGVTSVGFVGDPEFFKDYPEDPVERMKAIVQDCDFLKDRFKDQEMILSPRTIEGYAITSTKFFGHGFVTVGNATEFLDPVFSSGVTFAMESGSTAAKLVSRKLKGETVDFQKEYVDHMMQGINTFRTYVASWYNGDLHEIFFSKNQDPGIKRQICSVLAGYVWDLENPFVKKHERAVKALATIIRMQKASA
ncbi:MAG TPA: NAD(P)/FAD-dependent oxidoreductase [Bacteroidia bacterium]|jgi:flavin-dependent dehydrogenase|nr:NAD(P)/FAD-dependent oxidoreductase [Bacteroidia bacterium]